MSDWIGTGVVVASQTLTTTDVVEEGQLQVGYFPNCKDDLTKFDAFIASRIRDADVFVKKQVGSNYDNGIEADQIQIKNCVMYLVLARLWQIIKNVMDSYDAECLPPESVDPDQAAANRDFYKGEAESILVQYDTTPTVKNFIGSFDSDGVDSSQSFILGQTF
jgi:hypothetical protein